MEIDGKPSTGRSLYKSKKLSLLKSGRFYKMRAPNVKRTKGHGQYKTFAMLEVRENTGLGQCLYWSILQHLQHEKYTPFNREKVRSATEVRKEIIEYVIQNWFEYVVGFYNYDDEFQDKMYKYECLQWQNEKRCQKYYRKYMGNTTVWGTHVELAAACKLYDFKCVLLSVAVNRKTLSVSVMNDEVDKREVRRICHILHTSGNHFRFLKPFGTLLPIPVGTYDLKPTKSDSDGEDEDEDEEEDEGEDEDEDEDEDEGENKTIKKKENIFTATLVGKKPYTTTYAKYEFEDAE